ncbi:unnamed protein product [Rotaria sp. Silwood1]|nr:unnamed protein product [Rotaria sp. Silwood1]
MSYSKRDLNNPPDYYYTLNTEQKRNWQKTARRIEKNEKLRTQRLPFESSSDISIIHVHYKTTINILDELITTAQETKRYVVDTESQKMKKKKNKNNEIISWEPIGNEFKHFDHLDLIHIGNIVDINLQFLFSDQYNNPKTYPEMERRDDSTRRSSIHIYDTPGDNDIHDNDDDDDDDEETDDDYDDKYPVQYNSSHPISLQAAVATTFRKFIDKSLTVNHWQCGLNLNLNT